ncbi:Uncharacterized protein dnm_062330 [Desulfonema magnum]|uniref:Nucleotidyltransferase domain-containing protein n=1 Tax=Desulfonema magnum TaxID=45655 RepID=A0A975BR43_9BACT|nr:Uncharacterized protein dnm_062330 [Desulfonema magnum]
MYRDILIKQVKKAILEMEPDAEIILYGSRSRGNSTLLNLSEGVKLK